MNTELRKAKNLSDKHLMLFLLMNEWVKVKQRNRSIVEQLKKRGYRKVVVYGMSYVGQRLCDELSGSDIEIVGCVDQKGGGIYRGNDITTSENIPKDADVIIVTPIFYFDEIKHNLDSKTAADIVSLEEIIYGLDEAD